jgi:hypothetical protein
MIAASIAESAPRLDPGEQRERDLRADAADLISRSKSPAQQRREPHSTIAPARVWIRNAMPAPLSPRPEGRQADEDVVPTPFTPMTMRFDVFRGSTRAGVRSRSGRFASPQRRARRRVGKC